MTWWRRLLQRDRLERQLDAELRDHFERLVAHHLEAGLSPEEARRRARLEFGGLEQVKDACRDERGLRLLDDTVQDLRYAIRMLRRAPGFTIAVVLTVALGIGANAAIFSIVNAILLRPLPYDESDRLVHIVETIPASESMTGAPQRTTTMNMSEFIEWRPRATTLSHVAARQPVAMSLVRSDGAVRLMGTRVSPAMFTMLGATPMLGRLFEAAEEQPGSDRVVLLSYAAWQAYFGGDREVVGRPLLLDGTPYSIVGVMPRDFLLFPDAQTAVWLPLVVTHESGRFQRLEVIARLQDGVSVEAAASEAAAIFRELRGQPAVAADPSEPPPIQVVSWKDELVAPIRPALVVFVVAVGLVLSIACLNVANLFLVRATTRQRELAIRIALGAGRGRIARQFLTEGLFLTLMGAAAAFGVAQAGIRLLQALGRGLPGRQDLARLDGAGRTIPRLDEISIDGHVLLYMFVLALIIGGLFALGPAVRAWRMKRIQAGSFQAEPSGTRLVSARNLLVVGQLSLTLVLLLGAGLLIRSFLTLTQVDLGYDASNVITFQTTPGAFNDDAASNTRGIQFLDALTARLQGIPGVEAAGFTSGLPMVQSKFVLTLGARSGVQGTAIPGGLVFMVSQDYLRVMGVPLTAGRGFGDDDRRGSTRAYVINRTLAAQYFGATNPLGQPLHVWGLPGEVVGIVADVRQSGFHVQPEPQLFMDVRQVPANYPFGFTDGVYVAVRTASEAAAMVPMIRQVARELDPAMPIDAIATMDQIVSNSVTKPRSDAALMGIFAAAALLLAAVGVYGVVAYFVTERTHEIGVRVALGARRREVVAMVLRRAAALTGTGIVLGLMAGFGTSRYLAGMLYGLTPLDPATFVAVPLLCFVVAIAASYVPARRATTVDPLVALRYE